MCSGSTTTGHWDNQSLDHRSGSCTVGTIHLNPTAAGNCGERGEKSREEKKKLDKDEDRERGSKEEKCVEVRYQEWSQGEAVESRIECRE